MSISLAAYLLVLDGKARIRPFVHALQRELSQRGGLPAVEVIDQRVTHLHMRAQLANDGYATISARIETHGRIVCMMEQIATSDRRNLILHATDETAEFSERLACLGASVGELLATWEYDRDPPVIQGPVVWQMSRRQVRAWGPCHACGTVLGIKVYELHRTRRATCTRCGAVSEVELALKFSPVAPRLRALEANDE